MRSSLRVTAVSAVSLSVLLAVACGSDDAQVGSVPSAGAGGTSTVGGQPGHGGSAPTGGTSAAGHTTAGAPTAGGAGGTSAAGNTNGGSPAAGTGGSIAGGAAGNTNAGSSGSGPVGTSCTDAGGTCVSNDGGPSNTCVGGTQFSSPECPSQDVPGGGQVCCVAAGAGGSGGAPGCDSDPTCTAAGDPCANGAGTCVITNCEPAPGQTDSFKCELNAAGGSGGGEGGETCVQKGGTCVTTDAPPNLSCPSGALDSADPSCPDFPGVGGGQGCCVQPPGLTCTQKGGTCVTTGGEPGVACPNGTIDANDPSCPSDPGVGGAQGCCTVPAALLSCVQKGGTCVTTSEPASTTCPNGTVNDEDLSCPDGDGCCLVLSN